MAFTGDTNGDFSRYIEFTEQVKPTKKYEMIVLMCKEFMNSFPFTTFCIHGNYAMRTTDILLNNKGNG